MLHNRSACTKHILDLARLTVEWGRPQTSRTVAASLRKDSGTMGKDAKQLNHRLLYQLKDVEFRAAAVLLEPLGDFWYQ